MKITHKLLTLVLAAAMLLAMLPWSQPMKARASGTNELALSVGEMVDSITATQHTFRYAGMIDEEHDTQSLCYYTDSYFLKSADSYNASLATMSLCLELSCWPSHEKTDWYDSEITPDSREFWQDRLVNVKKLLLGDPEAEGDTGLGFCLRNPLFVDRLRLCGQPCPVQGLRKADGHFPEQLPGFPHNVAEIVFHGVPPFYFRQLPRIR